MTVDYDDDAIDTYSQHTCSTFISALYFHSLALAGRSAAIDIHIQNARRPFRPLDGIKETKCAIQRGLKLLTVFGYYISNVWVEVLENKVAIYKK